MAVWDAMMAADLASFGVSAVRRAGVATGVADGGGCDVERASSSMLDAGAGLAGVDADEVSIASTSTGGGAGGRRSGEGERGGDLPGGSRRDEIGG